MSRPLPPVLTRFWIALAALTALSIAYTATFAHVHHLPPPWGLPLLWDDSRWGDLLIFQPAFAHFRTPQFWSAFASDPFSYPAPLGVMLGLLFQSAHPVRTYMVLGFVGLAVAACVFVRQLTRRGIRPAVAWSFAISVLCMTWPLLFLVDTSNLEGMVVLFLAAGVLSILLRRYWLGATLIGIAGSMKVFPLVLLALLLSRRRYKEFSWGLITAAITTLVSLAILGPSIADAERHLETGFALARSRLFFSMSHLAPSFDHSLWMPVRFATVYLDRWLHPMPAAAQAARTARILPAALRAYLVVVAGGGILLYFTRIRRLPMLNQVLALTICAVLLPPLSLEYTLVHMLLPFGLLCAYAIDMSEKQAHSKGLAISFACFVLIFGVNSFLDHQFLFASEGRLVGLIILLVVVLRNPYPWLAEAHP